MLDATEEVLTERGYAATSLEEVARRTGVTKAALYHHFPNGKDELIVAVGQRMLERDHAGMTDAIALASGARAQLEAGATWMFGREPPSRANIARRGPVSPPQKSEEMAHRFMTALHAPIEEVMKRGVMSGELRPHDTTFATWAFLSLLAEFSALQHDLAAPDLAQRVVELLIAGIGPRHKRSR
jgi:AcrR family transcriptional regulator